MKYSVSSLLPENYFPKPLCRSTGSLLWDGSSGPRLPKDAMGNCIFFWLTQPETAFIVTPVSSFYKRTLALAFFSFIVFPIWLKPVPNIKGYCFSQWCKSLAGYCLPFYIIYIYIYIYIIFFIKKGNISACSVFILMSSCGSYLFMCCIVIKQGQIILSEETCGVEQNTLSSLERAKLASFVCGFTVHLLIVVLIYWFIDLFLVLCDIITVWMLEGEFIYVQTISFAGLLS